MNFISFSCVVKYYSPFDFFPTIEKCKKHSSPGGPSENKGQGGLAHGLCLQGMFFLQTSADRPLLPFGLWLNVTCGVRPVQAPPFNPAPPSPWSPSTFSILFTLPYFFLFAHSYPPLTCLIYLLLCLLGSSLGRGTLKGKHLSRSLLHSRAEVSALPTMGTQYAVSYLLPMAVY